MTFNHTNTPQVKTLKTLVEEIPEHRLRRRTWKTRSVQLKTLETNSPNSRQHSYLYYTRPHTATTPTQQSDTIAMATLSRRYVTIAHNVMTW